jgi:hypothetical protein
VRSALINSLGLRTFPGKSSDACGNIPKPSADLMPPGLGALSRKCPVSRDGVPRPQELAWVSKHFLERVPIPMAEFQSLGHIEFYQVLEPILENALGPRMESQKPAWVPEHFSKEFQGWQPSKALGKLNSTRSRSSSQKNVLGPGIKF